jgi:hypothetical protein
MGRTIKSLLFVVLTSLIFTVPVFAIDSIPPIKQKLSQEHQSFKPQPYSRNLDMAFVSVWGSRPDSKKLQGFQRAVLFTAKGEMVKQVDMRNDSIYSLDRMIQENKNKGPLIIKMYK